MYIKNNTIMITDNFSEVKAENIEVGDHIVLMEKVSDTDFLFRARTDDADCLTSMILKDVIFNKIYTFSCSSTFADNYNDYDYDGNVRKKCSGLCRSSFERTYLLNGEGEFVYLFQDEIIRINTISEGNTAKQKIYESLFLNKHDDININRFNVKQINDDNKITQYVPIELDKDNYLVFSIEHTMNYDKNYWYVYKEASILNKNKEYATIPMEYEEFSTIMKKSEFFYDFYYEPLEHMDRIAEYDLQDYLGDDKSERENKLYEIASSLRLFQSNDIINFRKMFEPMYERKEIELKIYSHTVKEHYKIASIVTVNDEVVNVDEIEDEDFKNYIKNEVRIASEINMFVRNNYTGINPVDGLLYKDGQADFKKMKEPAYHKDEEIVFFEHRHFINDSSYYVNVNGYYVLSQKNNAIDQEKIQEYLDRKAVMKELMESAEGDKKR